MKLSKDDKIRHSCQTQTGHRTYIVQIRTKNEGEVYGDPAFPEYDHEWKKFRMEKTDEGEPVGNVSILSRWKDDIFTPKGVGTYTYEAAMALAWNIKASEVYGDRVDVRVMPLTVNMQWELLYNFDDAESVGVDE